jgi:hypothetical protein
MREPVRAKAERLSLWGEEFLAEYEEARRELGASPDSWILGSCIGMSGLAMNELAYEGYIDRDGNRYRPGEIRLV